MVVKLNKTPTEEVIVAEVEPTSMVRDPREEEEVVTTRTKEATTITEVAAETTDLVAKEATAVVKSPTIPSSNEV